MDLFLKLDKLVYNKRGVEGKCSARVSELSTLLKHILSLVTLGQTYKTFCETPVLGQEKGFQLKRSLCLNRKICKSRLRLSP